MEDDNDGDWVKRTRDNPELAAEVLLSLSRQPPAAVVSPPAPVRVPVKRPRSRTITLQGIREEEAMRQRTSPETPQSFGNEKPRAKPPAAKRRRVDQPPSVSVGNAGGDPKRAIPSLQPPMSTASTEPQEIPSDQLRRSPGVPSTEQIFRVSIPLIDGDDLPDLEDNDEMPPLGSRSDIHPLHLPPRQ